MLWDQRTSSRISRNTEGRKMGSLGVIVEPLSFKPKEGRRDEGGNFLPPFVKKKKKKINTAGIQVTAELQRWSVNASFSPFDVVAG